MGLPDPSSGSISPVPAPPGILKGSAQAGRSQAPSSVENRVPPSFQVEAQATAGFQGAPPPRPQGTRARSGPGPRRPAEPRPDGGRWHAPGSFETPEPVGPSGLRALAPAWGGGGSVQRRRGPGERRGPVQREQPSVKGIVPAPQSRARARPLGAKLGAPRRAQASSCCTSARRLGARLARAVVPHPRPGSWQRGNLSFSDDSHPINRCRRLSTAAH